MEEHGNKNIQNPDEIGHSDLKEEEKLPKDEKEMPGSGKNERTSDTCRPIKVSDGSTTVTEKQRDNLPELLPENKRSDPSGIASLERKWGYIKLQNVEAVGQPSGCRRQINERGENVKTIFGTFLWEEWVCTLSDDIIINGICEWVVSEKLENSKIKSQLIKKYKQIQKKKFIELFQNYGVLISL